MTSVGQGFVGLAATVIQRVSMGKVRRWCAGLVVATMIATSMTGCAGDDNSKWRLLGTDAPPSTHGDWRVPSMNGPDFVTAYLLESGLAGHPGDTSKLNLMAAPGCVTCAAMVVETEEVQ